MAQSTKDFGMSKRIKKNSEDKLHHIFTELKNIVWSDLNRHFLDFISENGTLDFIISNLGVHQKT